LNINIWIIFIYILNHLFIEISFKTITFYNYIITLVYNLWSCFDRRVSDRNLNLEFNKKYLTQKLKIIMCYIVTMLIMYFLSTILTDFCFIFFQSLIWLDFYPFEIYEIIHQWPMDISVFSTLQMECNVTT